MAQTNSIVTFKTDLGEERRGVGRRGIGGEDLLHSRRRGEKRGRIEKRERRGVKGEVRIEKEIEKREEGKERREKRGEKRAERKDRREKR